MTIVSRLVVVVAAASTLSACAADAPLAATGICRAEPGSEAGLRVNAPSDAYFYADAPDGQQQGYALGGGVVALPPGDYVARLNNSRHAVAVEAGQVTTCAAATIDVDGSTSEYWYLLDSLGTQLGYALLGSPLGVFPGRYTIRVNNTRTSVSAEAPNVHAVGTGTFVVQGTTSEYFYVLGENGEQLAYSTLGNPISLLPGSYRARVNNTSAPFTVEAGRPAVLTAGVIVANGTTSEYYYVDDAAGEQLGYATLGSPTSWLPGTYTLRVNNRRVSIDVAPGATTAVPTGTINVHGPSGEYFYVLDEGGQQLAYSTLGTPLSLLAGEYRVRLNDRTAPVTIVANQNAVAAP